MYKVYILRTSRNTLYTGITNNLKNRLLTHKSKNGKSSKYMRSFESFKLVYTENYNNRSDASKRESEIKKLTKIKKESLIKSNELIWKHELL
jgi:putative endonuclease